MLRDKLYIITAVLALGLLARAAYTATQGTLGQTSTATLVISVSIPAEFRISGLADFAFGTYSGSGNFEADDDLCVYSNGSGDYNVIVTDNTSLSPTGFSAQNTTATADIPYIVRWNNQAGTGGNKLMTFNVPRASTGANTQASDCSAGGDSANLLVRFTRASLQSAPESFYAATLTVTIEP